MSTKTLVTVSILAAVGLGGFFFFRSSSDLTQEPARRTVAPSGDEGDVAGEGEQAATRDSGTEQSSVPGISEVETAKGEEKIDQLLARYRELVIGHPKTGIDDGAYSEATKILEELAGLPDPEAAYGALLDAISEHEQTNFCTFLRSDAVPHLVALWKKEPALRRVALEEFEDSENAWVQCFLGSGILADRGEFIQPEQAYARVIRSTDHPYAFSSLVGNVLNFGNDAATRELIHFAMTKGAPKGESPASAVATCYQSWYTILDSQGRASEIADDFTRDLVNLALRSDTIPNQRVRILRILKESGFAEAAALVAEKQRGRR